MWARSDCSVIQTWLLISSSCCKISFIDSSVDEVLVLSALNSDDSFEFRFAICLANFCTSLPISNFTAWMLSSQESFTSFIPLLWPMRCRGDLGGGCRGCAPPWDDLWFSNTTGILQKKKKTMWFIGVEVEQETSAPPLLKKILDPPLRWVPFLGRPLRCHK